MPLSVIPPSGLFQSSENLVEILGSIEVYIHGRTPTQTIRFSHESETRSIFNKYLILQQDIFTNFLFKCPMYPTTGMQPLSN